MKLYSSCTFDIPIVFQTEDARPRTLDDILKQFIPMLVKARKRIKKKKSATFAERPTLTRDG